MAPLEVLVANQLPVMRVQTEQQVIRVAAALAGLREVLEPLGRGGEAVAVAVAVVAL